MILYGPLLLICTRNVLIPHEKHLLILSIKEFLCIMINILTIALNSNSI